MEDLRFRFLERCQDRLDLMRRLASDMEPANTQQSLMEIRRLAHQMAGSGGVFQAGDISIIAGELEHACANQNASSLTITTLLGKLEKTIENS